MTAILAISAVVVLVCIVANKFTSRLGLPSLLIFLALGMFFGSDGMFKIPFDNYHFAEQICSVALIFIMFYGGFGTNWKAAKPIAVPAVLLSTVGVAVTALVTGAFCHFVLRFELLESFLIGSVISSTDAASVFSILRSKKLNLKYNTASLLEVESGSNDPIAYMLTIVALTLMGGKGTGSLVYLLFAQVVYGAIFGTVIALAAVFILRRVRFSSDGLETIFVLAVAVLAYALPTLLGGNGYLSVYLAGIILGNSHIRGTGPLVHFFDGITGLSQIAIFFLLGLLAFPSQIPSILLPSLAITLFLTFIARPVAVFGILTPMRKPFRQQLLVSWAGLRGAAAIVFAIMATVSPVSTNNDVFHIAFCVALFSVAIQGTLLPAIARKLRLVDNEDSVLKTFNDYQNDAEMQLIQIRLTDTHPWCGQTVSDLSLEANMLAVMVKRGDETIIPNGNTILQPEDTVILTGEAYREDNSSQLLYETALENEEEWEGRPIREIGLAKNAMVILIKRADGSIVVPNGQTLIQKGDRVVLNSYKKQ